MRFRDTLLRLLGATSGETTLKAAAVAGTNTLTLPAVTDTLAVLGANTFTATQTIDVGSTNTFKFAQQASYNILSLNGQTTNVPSIGLLGGGSTDGNLYLCTPTGGLFSFRTNGTDFIALSDGGTYTNAATGGAKGAGTINVSAGYYINGVQQGGWTNYTPTVSAQTGTFTTVSASGRYNKKGNEVTAQINIAITTNGTAGTFILASLPFAPGGSALVIGGFGRAGNTGKMQIATAGGGSNAAILNYDGTYSGASGESITVTVIYEV